MLMNVRMVVDIIAASSVRTFVVHLSASAMMAISWTMMMLTVLVCVYACVSMCMCIGTYVHEGMHVHLWTFGQCVYLCLLSCVLCECGSLVGVSKIMVMSKSTLVLMLFLLAIQN